MTSKWVLFAPLITVVEAAVVLAAVGAVAVVERYFLVLLRLLVLTCFCACRAGCISPCKSW